MAFSFINLLSVNTPAPCSRANCYKGGGMWPQLHPVVGPSKIKLCQAVSTGDPASPGQYKGPLKTPLNTPKNGLISEL